MELIDLSHETFSPVARFESLRMLLALAMQDSLHVHQLDMTTAFINGKLEEEEYILWVN